MCNIGGDYSKQLKSFIASLAKDSGAIYLAEPLRDHSSWQIGGNADILIEPDSVDGLLTVLKSVKNYNIPFIVIGAGTNILFDDNGFRGLVVKISKKMSQIRLMGNAIYAEAGVWAPCLAKQTCSKGLTGLEHIIGIPGTIGGLVYMNGGSQRKCIGDSVTKVNVLQDGDSFSIKKEDCDFAYRSSIFQRNNAIITSVELACNKSLTVSEIRKNMLAILKERKVKFPMKQPSCGSVFISDGDIYRKHGSPGQVIEEAGLKGYTLGGAQVSEKHANFIVNLGGAKAVDIIRLIKYVRKTVYKKIGFWLEAEVFFVSEEGLKVPVHQVL